MDTDLDAKLEIALAKAELKHAHKELDRWISVRENAQGHIDRLKAEIAKQQGKIASAKE